MTENPHDLDERDSALTTIADRRHVPFASMTVDLLNILSAGMTKTLVLEERVSLTTTIAARLQRRFAGMTIAYRLPLTRLQAHFAANPVAVAGSSPFGR